MTLSSHPKFITLEGGEGAGKSTQIDHLAEKFRSLGIEPVLTREPEGPIRDLLVRGDARWAPKSEALLHFAARAEHLEAVVQPALADGQWVICDRFADSTMAYQGYVQGAGPGFVSELYDLVVGSFAPDLTLILDLPVTTGLSRAQARKDGEDRYERMGQTFHESLREAFKEIAKLNPNRCVLIDADQGIDDVAETIWQAVSSRFDL